MNVQAISKASWVGWHNDGRQIATLRRTGNGNVLAGAVLVTGEFEYAAHYEILTDDRFRTRRVLVNFVPGPQLELLSDGNGRWWKPDSKEQLSSLDGCFDIDLAFTPSTNTLPILRLNLDSDQTVCVPAVYVQEPDYFGASVGIERLEQTYRCVSKATYFTYCSPGFSTDLFVDEAGFVRDYPEFFRRI